MKNNSLTKILAFSGLTFWFGSFMAQGEVVQVGTMVDPDNVIINNITPPLFQEVGSIPIVGDRTYVRDVDIFTGTSGVPTNPDGTPVDASVTFELLTTTVDDGVNNNSITAMDEWNLVTVAGRRSFSDDPDDQGGRPAWQTGNFGSRDTFTSTNDDGPDFILIENLANDDLLVQAVFPDGTTGQWTGLIVGDDQQAALWGDTGLISPDTSIGAGQGKFGVGWRVEDLLGADGNPLPQDTEIFALRFNDPTQSPDTGLDPCLLVAVIISDTVTGMWQKVTDFEDPDGMFAEFNGLDNNVVGGKIWNVDAEVPGFVGAEADPSPWAGDEGNMALHVEHPNTAGGMSTAFVLLPEDIADGSVATLYFRWWMNKNGGHEAGIFMASREEFLKFRPPYNVGETPADRNNTIRHGYGDHQTWWRIAGEFSISDFGYSSPGEVQRNAPPVNTDEYLGPEDSGKQFLGAIPEQQQYQSGVWMEMWVIYDTDNDIRMEYQRQNDGVQKQNHWAIIDADSNVEKVIDHMPNSKGITDADYPGFYLVNWVRPNPNYDTQVYMDDVWIDYTGINLTTPPHGKSRSRVAVDTTPRAAAVSAGSGTITMTMAPPPEAEVGAGVYLADGTGLGTIASISGNTLTLGAPLPASVTVPSNSALTFGDPVDTTAGKFINISTRAMVGTGDDVMIGGFIIGEGLQQVLVEAIGPELADRGVAGALADPVLTVTAADGTVLMVNDNWEDSQGQMVSDLWAGSPNVSAGSASSAAVLTLEPGNYTAKVEGKDGTTGVALVEVYQID